MSQFDELPEGWVWSELKDVCLKIQDGTHFSPKVQYQEPGEGRYLYITAKNIRNNGIDLSEVTYVDQEVHEEIFKRCNPENGDVLLVKDGVKTGDVTINTLEIDFSLLSSVSLLKPIREILCPNYLRFFFRSPIGFQLIIGQMNGSAIKRIVLDKIRKSYICLPPINEQRRIVEKIEVLTARSRKARAALDEIESYEEALISRYTSRWHESQLGEHIEEYKQLAGEYWNKYSIVGLSNEGKIVDRREPVGEKSAPRCKVVRPGDIVFNPIRFSIGSIARYHGAEDVIVSPEYQVISIKNTISGELLYRYLRSKAGKGRLEIETQGSVRYRVYFQNLQSLVMPIAPPDIQYQAEQFFLKLNKISHVIVELRQELDDLDQSILAKAFRGELVPQDPNDEPASVLLDRIRAERERLGSGKKRGKAKA